MVFVKILAEFTLTLKAAEILGIALDAENGGSAALIVSASSRLEQLLQSNKAGNGMWADVEIGVGLQEVL